LNYDCKLYLIVGVLSPCQASVLYVNDFQTYVVVHRTVRGNTSHRSASAVRTLFGFTLHPSPQTVVALIHQQ